MCVLEGDNGELKDLPSEITDDIFHPSFSVAFAANHGNEGFGTDHPPTNSQKNFQVGISFLQCQSPRIKSCNRKPTKSRYKDVFVFGQIYDCIAVNIFKKGNKGLMYHLGKM